MSQSPVGGAHNQTLHTASRSGVSVCSSEIQQLRHERATLTTHRRNLETESQKCQCALSSFEAQVRGMLEVKRQKSNSLQVDVLRRGAENPQLSQILDRSKDEGAQLQVRSRKIWRDPEHTHSIREMKYIVHQNQPESAAIGCGGLGTDVTILMEGVEPSSFAAAGDRLLVHLNSSCSTVCLGDPLTTPESSNVFVEEPEQLMEEKAEFEAWPTFGHFWIWRMNFRCEVSSGASRPTRLKPIADLKTSNVTTRATLQTDFEALDAKMASFLKKVINGDFQRRVFIEEEAVQKEETLSQGKAVRLFLSSASTV